MSINVDMTEPEKQKAYAESMANSGFDYSLAAGAAFIESMRNTYYRHTGTALDELIDNSIEAGASTIHIALGYNGKSDAKPDAIAIIDNGHGMVPAMLPLAATWGGTHRENSRTGLGRFGFGLPSASVNQARRYTIFSKTRDAEWSALTVDLDEIAKGKYNDASGKVVLPQAIEKPLPEWLSTYMKKNSLKIPSGTIVLWEKLDRLDWTTTTGLTKHLLEHFGIVFRGYLKDVDIFFDGTRIEPTDPLFITPGYRYYDVDEDRAEARPPQTVLVASKNSGEKVPITIRYALFPQSFFSIDKKKEAGRGNQNSRFQVAKENAGIVITRMGRQIDVLERAPWPGFERFRNDDRYWGMEIDFPAELDEEFTISNAKQGVVIKDRIWNILKENGVFAAMAKLRKDYLAARRAKASEPEEPGEKRASERAMEESSKFRSKRARTVSPEREEQARVALEQYVKRQAKQDNKPESAVRKEVEIKTSTNPYHIEFEKLPGAPFFRVEQIGGMQVLYINQEHGFFADVYASSDSTPFVKAALELILFCIGECELDAIGNSDRSHFYTVERQEWSMRLAGALASLGRDVVRPEMPEESNDDPEIVAAA